MKNQTTQSNAKTLLRNTLAAATIMLAGTELLQAEPLLPDTIYVTTSTGLYSVDEVAGTSVRVAEADPALSQIQDIAFDGETLHGLTSLMQFFIFDEVTNAMIPTNNASSYALSHYGLESRNGQFYAAEARVLQAANPQTGTFTNIGVYGLGADEQVTDLAFGADGVLYASVSFTLSYDYLATLNPATGEMNIIGNTFISGLRAMTEKNGVLYGMNSSGDLYSIDKVSGFGTMLASAVVPGAYGMTTSPAAMGNNMGSNGDASGGGALSLPLMLLMGVMIMLRARCSANSANI